jgi:hypothetical protein
MSRDNLKERERAFEAHFFEKESERLLEELKKNEQQEQARAALARMCGVDDAQILDELLGQGVGAENLTALVLVPLIAVAWVDREVSEAEAKVILGAAHEYGIEEGTSAFELLRNWLAERPGDALIDAWADYVRVLSAVFRPEDRERFADLVMGQAEGVAEATGGLLGFGSKTSAEEKRILERLASAFQS